MKIQLYNEKLDNYIILLLEQFFKNYEEFANNYNEENKIKTILLGKMLYDKINCLKNETEEDINLKCYLLAILNINLSSLIIVDNIKKRTK